MYVHDVSEEGLRWAQKADPEFADHAIVRKREDALGACDGPAPLCSRKPTSAAIQSNVAGDCTWQRSEKMRMVESKRICWRPWAQSGYGRVGEASRG
jgi:hypothetical protein